VVSGGLLVAVWSSLLHETSAKLAAIPSAQTKLIAFMARIFPRARQKVTPKFIFSSSSA
jgi:hypothetical protein